MNEASKIDSVPIIFVENKVNACIDLCYKNKTFPINSGIYTSCKFSLLFLSNIIVF